MRVIKVKRIQGFMADHAGARRSLEDWLAKTLAAQWADFNDLRSTFSKADQVRVASGKTTVVFNIGGNNFRMITAVHFNTGIAFVLRLMTRAEYSKDSWKETL